jgi:hypothetical protein
LTRKYGSIEEARRRNGVRGTATLGKRIRKYGREDILPKRVRVETMDEIDELKAAKKRIREGAVRALEMALNELPEGVFPVHHSDCGCRYCSRRYVETLAGRGLHVSMTEEAHCYENARAERLNGILKQEYGLGCSFRDKGQAIDAIKEAVFLYNTKRPHPAPNYETPEKTHRLGAA